MSDTAALRRILGDELINDHDDEHEHDRSLARTQMVFDIFYDDDDEPDVAISDALTDLMHISAKRGVDFLEVFEKASWQAQREREEWGIGA